MKEIIMCHAFGSILSWCWVVLGCTQFAIFRLAVFYRTKSRYFGNLVPTICMSQKGLQTGPFNAYLRVVSIGSIRPLQSNGRTVIPKSKCLFLPWK